MCVESRRETGIATFSCMSVILLVRSKKKVLCRGLVFFMGEKSQENSFYWSFGLSGGKWAGKERKAP